MEVRTSNRAPPAAVPAVPGLVVRQPPLRYHSTTLRLCCARSKSGDLVLIALLEQSLTRWIGISDFMRDFLLGALIMLFNVLMTVAKAASQGSVRQARTAPVTA